MKKRSTIPVLPAAVRERLAEIQGEIRPLLIARNNYAGGAVDALGIDKNKYGFDMDTLAFFEKKQAGE